MSIFAIGDLHLPGHQEKPMNVFGTQWDRHFDAISQNWLRLVGAEDTVLIPGDISWAMQLEDSLDDLNAIAALPGKKILLRGNHDYWWSSVGKIRALLPQGMYVLQNDALLLPCGTVVCGTRGWVFPTQQTALSQEDLKIYHRELLRLRMSIEAARKLHGEQIIVMLHYPPLYADGHATGFTDILEEYQISTVVYGHLHGMGIRNGFRGLRNGICYYLTSCDALNFSPLLIPIPSPQE